MRIEKALGAAGFLGLVAALGGCPGTLDDRDRFLDGGACPDVPTEIFATTCAGNGCHGPSMPASGLDLVSPGVAGRVVGKEAQGCSGTLADPDNPSGSLLYEKLLEHPSCGARMPLSHSPLSNEEIECVKEWIEAQGM